MSTIATSFAQWTIAGELKEKSGASIICRSAGCCWKIRRTASGSRRRNAACDSLVGWTPLLLERVDVLPERRPIGEAVLAREHELRVGENDPLLVGEHGANAVARVGVAGGEGLQQLLRLLLLLREAGVARQGATER